MGYAFISYGSRDREMVARIASDLLCAGALPPRLLIREDARILASRASVEMRAGPDSTSTLVRVLPRESLVRVVEGPRCVDGVNWWLVRFGGRQGWIIETLNGQYLVEPIAP